jgi:hypothetical protein
MTTARSSWRSKGAAALTLILVLAGSASTSAHRRDEYLQAARIAIDPDRVQIALDLTPGIAVAEEILAGIDRDGDKSISAGEARMYARALLRAVAIDVDGIALDLELVDSAFPAVDAVRRGEGTMRIDAVAGMAPRADGLHHLHYHNSHRSDIGVYLANALVPASDRVAVTAQRRDADQRELTIDYTLRPESPGGVRRTLSLGVTGACICLAFICRRRRSGCRNRDRRTCAEPA